MDETFLSLVFDSLKLSDDGKSFYTNSTLTFLLFTSINEETDNGVCGQIAILLCLFMGNHVYLAAFIISNIGHEGTMGFPPRNRCQDAEIISFNDVLHLFKHLLLLHPPLFYSKLRLVIII